MRTVPDGARWHVPCKCNLDVCVCSLARSWTTLTEWIGYTYSYDASRLDRHPEVAEKQMQECMATWTVDLPLCSLPLKTSLPESRPRHRESSGTLLVPPAINIKINITIIITTTTPPARSKYNRRSRPSKGVVVAVIMVAIAISITNKCVPAVVYSCCCWPGGRLKKVNVNVNTAAERRVDLDLVCPARASVFISFFSWLALRASAR